MLPAPDPRAFASVGPARCIARGCGQPLGADRRGASRSYCPGCLPTPAEREAAARAAPASGDEAVARAAQEAAAREAAAREAAARAAAARAAKEAAAREAAARAAREAAAREAAAREAAAREAAARAAAARVAKEAAAREAAAREAAAHEAAARSAPERAAPKATARCAGCRAPLGNDRRGASGRYCSECLPGGAPAGPRAQRAVPFAFTAEQREAIESDPSGSLLLRGDAGSGKTHVLAARAAWLQASPRAGSVLVLVATRALEAYVTDLLDLHGCRGDVQVRSFHAWALDTARAAGLLVTRWTEGEARDELLDSALEARDDAGTHRLLSLPTAFWLAELEWIADHGLDTREAYRGASRADRATSLQVRPRERDVAWDVHEDFVRRTREDGGWDVQDPAGLVRAARRLADGRRVDHVLVDGVQDFAVSWLAALAPVARVSLTLAGDLAQRVERRQFTWSQAGVALPPQRSRSLGPSRRTTHEIMTAAGHLATHSDPDHEAPGAPARHGPPVRRVLRDTRELLEEAIAQELAARLAERPTDSFLVLVPRAQQTPSLLEALGRAPGLAGRAVVVRGPKLLAVPGEVQVATLEQAKGLEWDHVWLHGLGDEVIPGRFVGSPEADAAAHADDMDRARRLIYMAMTRARQTLTISSTRPSSRLLEVVPAGTFVEA